MSNSTEQNNEFELYDNVEVYRNTCCACCGIPRVNQSYFLKPDGTVSKSTVDHMLLKSLGGSSLQTNLIPMCFECNQLRANIFAEFDEFIDWYWNGPNELPERNYSYLTDNPNKIKKPLIKMPVLKSKNLSKEVDVVIISGIKYKEYNHPLYGTSLIRMNE